MPPRALMKSMSTHTMVFMAGSTPPCTTPAPSHPVFLAHLLVAQVHDCSAPRIASNKRFFRLQSPLSQLHEERHCGVQ